MYQLPEDELPRCRANTLPRLKIPQAACLEPDGNHTLYSFHHSISPSLLLLYLSSNQRCRTHFVFSVEFSNISLAPACVIDTAPDNEMSPTIFGRERRDIIQRARFTLVIPLVCLTAKCIL